MSTFDYSLYLARQLRAGEVMTLSPAGIVRFFPSGQTPIDSLLLYCVVGAAVSAEYVEKAIIPRLSPGITVVRLPFL